MCPVRFVTYVSGRSFFDPLRNQIVQFSSPFSVPSGKVREEGIPTDMFSDALPYFD